MNVVADAYTRLYRPEDVAAQDLPLFDALNALADAMRLRWSKEGNWLQFRSITFYDDRLKEVPNRLLKRWAASRRQHGALTLDDLFEIAQLPDAQLDAEGMAEGARNCWGLAEWDLARSPSWRLRPHLRFLASFTPSQRQEAVSVAGLPLQKMTLAQQQQFITFALEYQDEPLQSLEELEGSALRVDYSLPGGYEWSPPGLWWYESAVPVGSGKRALRPPARGRTRDEALQAARRTDPRVLAAMLEEARRLNPELVEAQMLPQESQIVPTPLDLTIVYMPGSSLARPLRVISASDEFPVRIGGNSAP